MTPSKEVRDAGGGKGEGREPRAKIRKEAWEAKEKALSPGSS